MAVMVMLYTTVLSTKMRNADGRSGHGGGEAEGQWINSDRACANPGYNPQITKNNKIYFFGEDTATRHLVPYHHTACRTKATQKAPNNQSTTRIMQRRWRSYWASRSLKAGAASRPTSARSSPASRKTAWATDFCSAILKIPHQRFW